MSKLEKLSFQFFDKVPEEILSEIGNFLLLGEFHKWMLVNRIVYQKLCSDVCYSKFYWREIKYHCNADEKKYVIYNPVTLEYHSNVHSLYSIYGKVSSNFRYHLLQFKKEISNNKPNFSFTPIENMMEINPKLQKSLEKDEFPGYGKICLIGNSTCGKTSLYWRVHTREFQETFWYTSDNPNLVYGNFLMSLWDLPCRDG